MGQKRILVVDDSPVVLKALSMKLKPAGYDVHTASDGAEALGKIRRDKPDLILLDISFPPDVGHGGGVSWDGFLIMDWLRRMDEAKHIPIIVITGSDPAKYQDRALAAGAVGLFQKPIDPAKLLEAIGQALGQPVAVEQSQPATSCEI